MGKVFFAFPLSNDYITIYPTGMLVATLYSVILTAVKDIPPPHCPRCMFTNSHA